MTAGTGLGLKDTQCGFKAFRTPAARLLFHLVRIDRFAFDVEILARARRLGLGITEVPVQWKHVEGSTVHPLHDSFDHAGRRLPLAAGPAGRRRRCPSSRCVPVRTSRSAPDGVGDLARPGRQTAGARSSTGHRSRWWRSARRRSPLCSPWWSRPTWPRAHAALRGRARRPTTVDPAGPDRSTALAGLGPLAGRLRPRSRPDPAGMARADTAGVRCTGVSADPVERHGHGLRAGPHPGATADVTDDRSCDRPSPDTGPRAGRIGPSRRPDARRSTGRA